jgi:hypothetical protein
LERFERDVLGSDQKFAGEGGFGGTASEGFFGGDECGVRVVIFFG